MGGLLRRNCQFNASSSLRANYRQKHQYHCRDYYKLHFLFHENEAGLQIPAADRRMGGRSSQGLKRKVLYLYFVPEDCILKLAGEGRVGNQKKLFQV